MGEEWKPPSPGCLALVGHSGLQLGRIVGVTGARGRRSWGSGVPIICPKMEGLCRAATAGSQRRIRVMLGPMPLCLLRLGTEMGLLQGWGPRLTTTALLRQQAHPGDQSWVQPQLQDRQVSGG